MLVGTCWIDLRIPGVRSLKEKRRVIKSLKERLHGNFNVSVAEVGALDIWQRAEIGLACVSNDRAFIDRMIAGMIEWIRSDPQISIIDFHTEIL